jgi:hypothetical protein
MNSKETEEEIQDILEPLERKIGECINSVNKMRELSSQEDLSRFDVITLMLKNAKELLRDPSERTNISYLASELREVFSELFSHKNKKYKVGNIVNTIELESPTQEIDDSTIQQVKDLNLEKIEEITKTHIICRGEFKDKEIWLLKFINGGRTYKKMITEVEHLVGPTNFKHLHIISNLQYWGPIFAIKEEKLFNIARDIKSSYSTLSKYVHIDKENQDISNTLSKYNQKDSLEKSQEELANLKSLQTTCTEIIQSLTIFDNFTLLPTEKYSIIDELIKE